MSEKVELEKNIFEAETRVKETKEKEKKTRTSKVKTRCFVKVRTIGKVEWSLKATSSITQYETSERCIFQLSSNNLSLLAVAVGAI